MRGSQVFLAGGHITVLVASMANSEFEERCSSEQNPHIRPPKVPAQHEGRGKAIGFLIWAVVPLWRHHHI